MSQQTAVLREAPVSERQMVDVQQLLADIGARKDQAEKDLQACFLEVTGTRRKPCHPTDLMKHPKLTDDPHAGYSYGKCTALEELGFHVERMAPRELEQSSTVNAGGWSAWQVDRYIIAARSKAEAVGVFAVEIGSDDLHHIANDRMLQLELSEAAWPDYEREDDKGRQVPIGELLNGLTSPRLLLCLPQWQIARRVSESSKEPVD